MTGQRLMQAPESVEAALRGELAQGALRRMALRPMHYGLADLIRECGPTLGGSTSLRLLRTRYKPDRTLSAYYDLPDVGGRLLALRWSTRPEAPPLALVEIEAEARDRGLLAPFTHLAATSTDGPASLLINPADPTMLQLVRLSSAHHVMRLLTSLTPSYGVQPETSDLVVIRYRPGQRHILRATLDRADRRLVFVKADRDDSGAAAVAAARAFGPVLSARCPGARLAEPWGYAVHDRAAAWKGETGEPLWRVLTRSDPSAPRAMGLVGRALRILHGDALQATAMPVELGIGAWRGREVSVEIATTLRSAEHIHVLLPTVGTMLGDLAHEIAHRLDQLPHEPPSFLHGDAKCDNILADGDGICLIDLDRCGLGDPALDLGKLLADLRWWGGTLGVDPAGATNALVAGYGDCDASRWARARLVAVMYQLRFAARRSAIHDVGWSLQVRRQVADAAARLDQERAA